MLRRTPGLLWTNLLPRAYLIWRGKHRALTGLENLQGQSPKPASMLNYPQDEFIFFLTLAPSNWWYHLLYLPHAQLETSPFLFPQFTLHRRWGAVRDMSLLAAEPVLAPQALLRGWVLQPHCLSDIPWASLVCQFLSFTRKSQGIGQ